MNVALSGLICFFLVLVGVTSAVPPDVCSQEFKWQDCGMPPKAVIYHYKSGSRCEVGFWRGCLPNPNMFVDEYECVQTCIFSVRARPPNYHSFQDNMIDEVFDDTTINEDTMTLVPHAENETRTETTSETEGGSDVESKTEGNAEIDNRNDTTTIEHEEVGSDATTADVDVVQNEDPDATEPSEVAAETDPPVE